MEGMGLEDSRYSELWQSLELQTIIVHFKKVNGESRLLLGTRNMTTVGLVCDNDLRGKLAGFDKKSSLTNHNIAVVDLVLGDVRTFCVSDARLIAYQLLGVVTEDNVELAFKYYNKLKDELDAQTREAKNKTISAGDGQSLIDII